MSFPNIRTKIRAILNDNLITQKDVYTYDTSKVFTLSQDNSLILILNKLTLLIVLKICLINNNITFQQIIFIS